MVYLADAMKLFFKYVTLPICAAIALCLLFTHPACTTPPEKNTPEYVTTAFYTAFREKNFSKAKKYATPESAGLLDIMQTLGEKAENALIADAKADFSLKTLAESDSTATVQVVLPDHTKAIVMPLVKSNGIWKVAFDKSMD
ncbi:hypothetical protein GCM10011379_08880 [Filimonas zeae]|uniref:DUF4878 domain-containing protein n=2 Tax=Filimonas zeae TaxID=1737353 RepID=A0A917MS00_9BACT|nr:hypothetical protein GCM10011379_08880 [Filimonas zeae]